MSRYQLARRFCEGKVVADVACGTGYGSGILREVAASVDSYDKEPLVGNSAIDLEWESWDARYEVIVSFETIDHLENPEFVLENARKTTDLLVVSSPIGELPSYNPHHKPVRTLPVSLAMLEKEFDCTVYYQTGETISDEPTKPIRYVIVAAAPRN